MAFVKPEQLNGACRCVAMNLDHLTHWIIWIILGVFACPVWIGYLLRNSSHCSSLWISLEVKKNKNEKHTAFCFRSVFTHFLFYMDPHNASFFFFLSTQPIEDFCHILTLIFFALLKPTHSLALVSLMGRAFAITAILILMTYSKHHRSGVCEAH